MRTISMGPTPAFIGHNFETVDLIERHQTPSDFHPSRRDLQLETGSSPSGQTPSLIANTQIVLPYCGQ
jgi:hypothetical protein